MTTGAGWTVASLLTRVAGEGGWRFPDRDAHDWKPGADGVVEDDLRDMLDGGIGVDEEDGLSERLQGGDERVVATKHHLVVNRLINPALDDALDVAEIADHVAIVERAGAHFDFRDRVVAVRVFADAVVVEQAMAVAELELLGD